MARYPSLARDRAGAVTIELALLAPILAAMVIGLIDLSTAYSDKLRLEQVAQRTVERIQQDGFTVDMKDSLETEAETEAGTGAVADLTYWLECNGVKKTGASAYSDGCGEGEINERYVQLDIQKGHTPIIPAKFGGANADGTFTLHGIAGIRIQ